jgi:TolB-like protein
VQRGVAEQQAGVAAERRIVFRIGVNLGDVVVEGEDLLGDGVNIAARLEQLSEPGGVLISGTAYDHLQGRLGLPIEDAGEQQVKNMARPVRAYRVRLDGTAVTASPYRHLGIHRPLGRKLIVVAAAVLLLLAGVGWWLWPTAPVGTGRPAIAVLPFDNLGGDEATGRLAEGITEDIITDLSRFRDLDVIARNSTGTYKGRAMDVRQVGQELKVRYVLEGSIQRQGDRLRATAQLVDATTGAHVWSDRWDRPTEDLFAVQTEIAEQVAARLGDYGAVELAERATARQARPRSLTAYELTLRGEEAADNHTRADAEEAVRLFTQAVEKDPASARALTGLAWSHEERISFGADPRTERQAALDAAQRAVRLDPANAHAHDVLGYVLGNLGNFPQAAAEYDTALRLNPGSVEILTHYAGWAVAFGEAERGAEAADRATRLNPNYPVWAGNFYRQTYFMAGRYADALRIIEQPPLEKVTRWGHVLRPAIYAALDRHAEAHAAVADALARFPNLSIQGIFSDPGVSGYERLRLAGPLRDAGFPVCAKPEELAKFEKPFRLPECPSPGVVN